MKHLADPAPGRPVAPDASPAPSHSARRVLETFALSEEACSLVQPYLDELAGLIPRLKPWRGFFAGAWVVGVRTPPEEGRQTRADYSRFEVQLSVDGSTGELQVTCRSTLRSRDLPTEALSLAFDDSGPGRLSAWLEPLVLRFAACYLEPVPAGGG